MGWMEKAVRSVRAKARGSVEAGRVEVGESGGVRAEGEIEDRSRMVREEMATAAVEKCQSECVSV